MREDLSSVSLSRETLKGTAAKFVMAAIGFGGTIVFGRLLGPTAFGAYYELLSVSQIGARPLAGWGNAAKKRFSEAQTDPHEIVGANYIGSILWILGTLVIIAAFSSVLVEYAGIVAAPLFIGALLIPLAAFESLNVLVTGTGRVGATKWIDAGRSVVTFGGQIALVLLGYGVFGMVVGFSVATLVTIPVLAWYLRVRPEVPSRETVNSMWQYAKYSIPTGVVGMTYEQFDIILLGAIFSSSVTGHYKAVAVLTLPGFFISEVASEGLMSKVSRDHSQNKSITTDVSNVLAFASLGSLPVFFGGAALLSPLIIILFGSEYAQAVEFFLPLAAARVIGTQIFPLYNAVEGMNRPDLSFRISIVALFTNIILGVVLAITVGPVGVVYATLASKIIQYIAYRWALSRNTTDVRYLTRPFVEQFTVAMGMYLVVRGLRSIFPVTGWITLLALVGAGAVVYVGALFAISDQFRETVQTALTG